MARRKRAIGPGDRPTSPPLCASLIQDCQVVKDTGLRVGHSEFIVGLFNESRVMTITVEATYENGVLRPLTPLALADNERVTLTIEPARNRTEATYGLIGWKGDSETIQRIALDPEFSSLESP